jgi:hypothetical protein
VKAPASWAHSIRFAQWCDWAWSKESFIAAHRVFERGLNPLNNSRGLIVLVLMVPFIAEAEVLGFARE